MSTKRVDERAVAAFTKLFFSDKHLVCEAKQLWRPHENVAQCAVRFNWEPARPEPRYASVSMAVYAWLEQALGSREPYDLYEELLRAGRDEPARGVTIDPGTGLLVIVDAGHLMCPRRGDWVVYVQDQGFSVMPDEVFRDTWKTLR